MYNKQKPEADVRGPATCGEPCRPLGTSHSILCPERADFYCKGCNRVLCEFHSPRDMHACAKRDERVIGPVLVEQVVRQWDDFSGLKVEELPVWYEVGAQAVAYGADVYTVLAALWLRKDAARVTKTERAKAKLRLLVVLTVRDGRSIDKELRGWTRLHRQRERELRGSQAQGGKA